MTRIRFHQGLDDLREKMLGMSGMAEQAVDRAVRAYLNGDLSLAEEVYRSEHDINRTEKDIDELAFDLLAMQQPMAVDLRFILAVIKINADLERVGDQAVNIAQRTRSQPASDLPFDLPRMASLARTMVHQAIQAFVARDAELARTILGSDDAVDDINTEAHRTMQQAIQTQHAGAVAALDALLVARNLERVADHATNIAEDVIFWLQGADVRHGKDAQSGVAPH
jgi:phosphate transport system protein